MVVITTVTGSGCYATRGAQTDAQGGGNAAVGVLAQEGTGAAQAALSSLLQSRVGCPPKQEENTQ